MTLRKLTLGIGLIAGLTFAGFGFRPATTAAPLDGTQSTDASEVDAADDTRLPPLSPDQLPLQFPARIKGAAAATTENSDEIVEANDAAARPGLIETLRGTIGGSPVFEESGVQDSLLESLDAAQHEINRVKRDNRRALRDMNRQLRVGSAAIAPHLVLITISDIAYADLGCFDGHAMTPHLDVLAAQGMRFTSCYAASNNAGAARWSLLTGLNVGHAPAATSGDAAERFALSGSQTTVAELLWRAGYSTAFVGIWRDRESPLDHGSDEWSGLAGRPALDPFAEYVYFDNSKARLTPNTDGHDGLAVLDLLLDEAIASFRRRSTEGRPCFLHLAVSPQMAAVRTADNGAAGMLPGQLSELDSQLGRFLSAIEESGLKNRCCIIVAGESTPPALTTALDHVSHARTGGLRTSLDGLGDGNLRVPLLVRWPERVAAGSVSDHVCATWDLLPTLTELAAAQRKPRQLDGISLAGALTGRKQRTHTLLYWETREGGFGQAVRKGRWKGVRAPGQSTLALYDLVADPAEQINLAAEHPAVVEQLIVRRR